MAQTSIPRLRSVKFKDGRGELRVLPTLQRDGREMVKRHVRNVIETHQGDICGFALVVWGPDLSSTADAASGAGSSIPSILVPDFVRARLLAAKIEEWMLDTVWNRR